MADYYSVITHAVSNLPSQTVEARWAVYDNACTALQEKLLTLDPPISEHELANEQLSLEAAIRRVEEDLLLGTMRRFVKEEVRPTTPSLSVIPTVTEFVRSGENKVKDAITFVHDHLISSGATELVPTKAEITARLTQIVALVQRTQLQTKAVGRRIYLSILDMYREVS
jgi:hypothetical protein